MAGRKLRLAQLRAVHSDTRLVIVGDGPLRAQSEGLIQELGLKDSVALAGHQLTPYAIMDATDGFLPSDGVEEQAMMFVAALTLERAVVTVPFGLL